MEQRKQKASLEVTMFAAQTSLLKRIDELRRCNNPEAADTWQRVYTRLYGAQTHQGLSRAEVLFHARDNPDLKQDLTD